MILGQLQNVQTSSKQHKAPQALRLSTGCKTDVCFAVQASIFLFTTPPEPALERSQPLSEGNQQNVCA
jgi:hypothetical protein